MAPASATNQKPNDVKDKKHASRASSTSKADVDGPSSESNGTEPAYLKELQKSLRNAAKKLNATAKIDAVLAENPGKSLEDLVEEKKINADQKAQALKKPALQASVAQIEEQIGHYRQFAAQYEEQLAKQKAELEKAHQKELEVVRANAIADATEATTRVLQGQFLSVSKFLCAAANLRRAGEESPESRAFESVLFQVYGGSQEAVTSMVKLVEGADEKIVSIEGETLELTYGDVKQGSKKYAPAEEATTEAVTETNPASDPTLVNAGLTELQDTSLSTETTQAAPEAPSQPEQVPPPSQTIVSDAANQVAESTYDPTSMTSSATTDDWVNVPRDPAETETGLDATPANLESSAVVDGPEQKGQSGGRGRGGRGRGRGEGFRGRGRGDFRGRGRGGRGGRGRGRGGANGSPATTPSTSNQP
ncbi:uncharacterized protein N7459_003942 [Penicillium hispanicum]|uniref:uncharacterized protein n=1 Tax=Penicillium hispanicum TaxID=1080232 RepID=UPI00253F6849|nr:uncharacterized protein N7459_003942 [Penicillium hispanicum]KAJ5584142.1 hypothetical protein N7459_003942 [Penicillium hispanicum]